MKIGISGFGLFLSKNGRFVTVDCCCFFWLAETLFLSCFGGAHFLGQVVKKGMFWRKETQNILTDN